MSSGASLPINPIRPGVSSGPGKFSAVASSHSSATKAATIKPFRVARITSASSAFDLLSFQGFIVFCNDNKTIIGSIFR